MIRSDKYATYVIKEEEADLRLDRWLQITCPSLSVHRRQKAIRLGDVRVNGKKAAPSLRLQQDDCVWVFHKLLSLNEDALALKKERSSLPKDFPCLSPFILCETKEFIALNKPAGYATQGGTGLKVDLLSALSKQRGEKLYMVHRLDKDTSGVWVVARNRSFATLFSHMLQQGLLKKTYVALLKGHLSKEVIAEGSYVSYLLKEAKGSRENVVSYPTEKKGAKKAVTAFQVIAQQKDLKTNDTLFYMRFMPLTGRTHQLRIHAQALGAPIVGDRRYGPSLKGARKKPALCLHAQTLCFQTEKAASSVLLEAPMSDAFHNCLKDYGFDLDDLKVRLATPKRGHK
ncbi:MAG: RluA family pseudouridine synthase [Holosporaceae bacterium]